MYEPRQQTITLKAETGAKAITEGMKLALVLEGARRIYQVDAAKKTADGYHLEVTLLDLQSPS